MSLLVFYPSDYLLLSFFPIQANMYDFTPAAILNLIKISISIYSGMPIP